MSRTHLTQDAKNNTHTVCHATWKIVLAILGILVLCAFFFVLRFGISTGISMQPTLSYHAIVLGETLSTPRAGDIVVVKATEEHRELIKRVIATEGQTVSIGVDGRTYIDGELLDEPYVERWDCHPMEAVVVPEGCYFVLGDNRPQSKDSRDYGCVHRDEIRCVVFFYTSGKELREYEG